MDTLIHADVFFFVTTIAVIIIALLFAIVLIYLIYILHRIKDIAEQVRQETVLFREDVRGLRRVVRREGFTLKHVFDLALRFITGSRRKHPASRK